MAQRSGKAIRVDFNNALSTKVGDHGIEPKTISRWQERIGEIHAELEWELNRGGLGFRWLPHQKQTVTKVREVAGKLRGKVDNFVVLGIGGAALGGIALRTALRGRFYNEQPEARRNGCPRIFIEDNIDPERFGALMDHIDIKKTAFNVISKSGATAETMAQFLIVRQMLQDALGKKFRDRVVVTTDPETGYLREIVAQDGYQHVLDIPQGVGGRFSVLSPVGLLSAEMAGIDIGRILMGARAMDKRCKDANIWENPAYLSALVHYLADTEAGKSVSVIWPYSDSLSRVGDWYCQLWAESLGKFTDPEKKEGSVGQTPLKSVGATDQHSMLQLYMEGPNDKIFTFIAVRQYRRTVEIPKAFPELLGAGYLGGQSLNSLIQAERRGVTLALADAHRPSITIALPEISEHAVGQLLMMLEIQTAVAGLLYGVNAFDQPGVQTGKDLTFAQMGRRDKASLKSQIMRRMKSDPQYIL